MRSDLCDGFLQHSRRLAFICRRNAGLRAPLHPEENLEAVDVALIWTAVRTIDMAAYVLSDVAIIDALTAAATRGVRVCIYLDPSGHEFFGAVADALRRLHDSANVTEFTKLSGALMHLKAYAVDGAVLRTGSANFSRSGERGQDNDLVIDRDASAAARFVDKFERMLGREG